MSDASDPRERLLALIRQYLAGDLSLSKFSRAYSHEVLDGEREVSLTPEEDAFFGDILEQADLVGADPTVEERGYGLRTEKEFREWLRQFMEGIAL